jgi:nitrate/nitrite transport system ATP-binding protein
MITHDVDEAILLSDKIMLMSNGPNARIAEIVENTLPKNRERATMHHDPMYYPMRNHLVDFLVHRSKLVQQAASSGSPVSNVTDITQRLKPKLVRPGKDHPLSNPSIQIN